VEVLFGSQEKFSGKETPAERRAASPQQVGKERGEDQREKSDGPGAEKRRGGRRGGPAGYDQKDRFGGPEGYYQKKHRGPQKIKNAAVCEPFGSGPVKVQVKAYGGGKEDQWEPRKIR
jgi:hypothetical protein